MAKQTILVVGLGSIGRRHARLISERDDLELLLCDPIRQFVEETGGQLRRPAIATFDDYAAALQRKPDIVYIATPNRLHVPMGLQALEAGSDVMVEKPIADDVPTATRLVESAEKQGRFLHVGYMMRFDDGLQKLKRIVDDGGIGNLVGGRDLIGTYITLLNARSPDRASHPNSLIVDYTHEMDFIRWIFGPARSVVSVGARLGDMELKPQPNIFQTTLVTQSGALVQLHMDYIQYPQRRIFEIYGDRGTLAYDFMTGEIRRFKYQKEHQWESLDVAPLTSRVDDMYRRQLQSILERRTAGQPPLVSGRDGLAALATAQAMIDSAAAGRMVEIR